MRIIRIIRLSALESAIARFDGWWSARSRREQWMLGGLAAFLGVLILVYGVIFPLQNARARAFADIRTYETLNARMRAAGTLTPNRPAPRTGPPVQVINGSAAGFGLSVQAEAIPGGVRATIADANYDSVIAWLAELGAASRLSVRRVSIARQPAPGRVSATVDFAQ